jgi:hypothetical protein
MSSRTAFVAAVPVTNLPLPTLAHDIYSHLRDEGGGSCCDDQDCRPAVYRLTARGVQMYVDQRWINVPNERIQYRALPGDRGETGGGHWCGSAYEPDSAISKVCTLRNARSCRLNLPRPGKSRRSSEKFRVERTYTPAEGT